MYNKHIMYICIVPLQICRVSRIFQKIQINTSNQGWWNKGARGGHSRLRAFLKFFIFSIIQLPYFFFLIQWAPQEKFSRFAFAQNFN